MKKIFYYIIAIIITLFFINFAMTKFVNFIEKPINNMEQQIIN